MSARIKLLLVALLAGAGFLVWQFNAATGGVKSTETTADISDGIGLTVAARDSDNDGLLDSEETYWNADYRNADTDGDGYKDGEEVLAGHSPIKAGPDDLLNGKKSITDYASAIILGNAIAGKLDPNNPSYDLAVQQVIEDMFFQYQENVSSDARDVIIAGKDTRDAIITYGFTMSNTIEPIFTDTAKGFASVIETIEDVQLEDLSKLRTTDPARADRFGAAISTEIKALDERAQKVRKIAVPSGMKPTHENVLMLLRGAQQQYRLLSAVSRDPVQALIALQVLSALTTRSSVEISQDFAGRLSSALQTK